MTDKCRSCGAPIRWAQTERGNRMPLDLEPTAGGNITLVSQGDGAMPLAKVHAASPSIVAGKMILEIFCCSGGMAEGLRRAGLQPDLAFDRDDDACNSYAANLGHRPFIVFRSGRPNNEGVVAAGFRTEDDAHASLERHASLENRARQAA